MKEFLIELDKKICKKINTMVSEYNKMYCFPCHRSQYDELNYKQFKREIEFLNKIKDEIQIELDNNYTYDLKGLDKVLDEIRELLSKHLYGVYL